MRILTWHPHTGPTSGPRAGAVSQRESANVRHQGFVTGESAGHQQRREGRVGDSNGPRTVPRPREQERQSQFHSTFQQVLIVTADRDRRQTSARGCARDRVLLMCSKKTLTVKSKATRPSFTQRKCHSSSEHGTGAFYWNALERFKLLNRCLGDDF